jgi:hypothetical protein
MSRTTSMPRAIRITLTLAALGFASLSSAAGAAVPKRGTWEGDTSQASIRPATVDFRVPRGAHFLKNLSFDWRAYCNRGGSVDDGTAIDKLRVRYSRGRRTFTSRATYTSKVPGKPLTENVTESFNGAFKSRTRARGGLRVELDLVDPAAGNAVVDHCSSGSVRWSAENFKRGLL